MLSEFIESDWMMNEWTMNDEWMWFAEWKKTREHSPLAAVEIGFHEIAMLLAGFLQMYDCDVSHRMVSHSRERSATTHNGFNSEEDKNIGSTET